MDGSDLFTGKLVRLSAAEPKDLGETFTGWSRNSRLWRLLDTDPNVLWSPQKRIEWERKSQEELGKNSVFVIRTRQEGRLIGYTTLWEPEGQHAESWFTIAIGEENCWGQGYGSDATRLMLRYGFHELNLQRISLGVFGYNQRAIHVYEKLGFRLEGVTRHLIRRAGQYYDVNFMGILRREWEAQHNPGAVL